MTTFKRWRTNSGSESWVPAPGPRSLVLRVGCGGNSITTMDGKALSRRGRSHHDDRRVRSGPSRFEPPRLPNTKRAVTDRRWGLNIDCNVDGNVDNCVDANKACGADRSCRAVITPAQGRHQGGVTSRKASDLGQSGAVSQRHHAPQGVAAFLGSLRFAACRPPSCAGKPARARLASEGCKSGVTKNGPCSLSTGTGPSGSSRTEAAPPVCRRSSGLRSARRKFPREIVSRNRLLMAGIEGEGRRKETTWADPKGLA